MYKRCGTSNDFEELLDHEFFAELDRDEILMREGDPPLAAEESKETEKLDAMETLDMDKIQSLPEPDSLKLIKENQSMFNDFKNDPNRAGSTATSKRASNISGRPSEPSKRDKR